MADQYSPSVPRRARSRSRGNAVAEAREREAAAARTPTPTQPPPVPSAYLPPMVSRGRAQTPQQPPSSFPGDPSAAQLPASPAGSAVSASGADAVPGRPGRPQRERGWAAKFGSGNWKHLAMGGGGSGGGSGASGSDVGSNISAPSTPSQADRLAGGARNVADGVMRMFAGGGSSGNDPRSGGTDGGRGRGGSVGASGNAVVLEVEQARFVDDRFDPDEYILTALHNNSEDGVRSFYRKLGDAKDTAATDLKANVYKNYGEFVVISKEIAQLETDMLMLRGLLTDMRGVHSHFRAAIGMASAADEDANTETDASRGSRKRGGGGSNADPGSGVGDMAGSTVNLNGSTSSTGTTQQQQLQALQAMYDTVEHAAKVLPPLGPGLPPRTMVHQGPLLELDAAYRFKNSVHAYLVSDAVLVATKRRRGLKSRYVADRMLGVAEVSILDVRDSPDVACAFKLVRGTAAVVYRADSLAEKKAWMVAIKRQCDEWNTATANAAAGLPVAGMVGDAGPGGGGEDGASFAPEVARPRLSKEAEARLQEQLDELDVLIASRDFDKALEQIDHLKAQNATGLAPRLSVLCTVLERDLMHVAAVGARRPVVTTIARLVALGHTSRARDAFLAARAAAVRDAGRRIRFQGDLAAYVRDFGAVVTLGVRVTADWYREAIPDPDHAAFLVQWARDQTRELALACVRQVSDESLTVVVSCLQASVEHIRAMRAAGLELEYVLWETVAEHVAKAIEVFERQCAELVARGIIEDTFDPIKNDYNDGITRSTMQFCKTMSVPSFSLSRAYNADQVTAA
ncbi:hypothetical protein BC828DRAFT_42770 [Blastocladiella britannica]|nr:hypothetical protein BC828DRAFT_42770 [Blastocladiella britannica]